MAHTRKERKNNDVDLADNNEARPPCPCWGFPFCGVTAVILLMLSAGGQAAHRTASLGQRKVLQCLVLTIPHLASSCTEKLEVIRWEMPSILVTKPSKLSTLQTFLPSFYMSYQKSCPRCYGQSLSHLLRTLGLIYDFSLPYSPRFFLN